MKATIGAILMMSAACAPVPPADAEVPVQGEGRCDATKAQHLVGRQASAELGGDALRLTGARRLRWIPKDGVVTMDYREDRLNLHLDGRNKVVRVDCG
jgi:hypothetical protein